MFVHYRTLGIILKKEDRGEANQVFTILTKDFGKLKVLGKAIRKIKSKLRAGARIFCLSEIGFIQGKAYKTLTDAVLVEKFSGISKNLEKMKVASEIAGVLDSLVKGEEADKEIWGLVLEAFRRLDNCSSCSLIYYYFLWNLFSILGYRPELENCPLCRKKLVPDNLYLDPEQGGVVCGNCFGKEKKGEKIDPETVKILRLLLKEDWSILSRLKIDSKHREGLEEISESYLSSISDFS